MHIVLKQALLLTALLAAARSAAATETLSSAHPQPAQLVLEPLDDTALTLLADAAVAASQAPPSAQAVSPVPEPPVYIMLLVGVGLVGLAAKRQPVPPIFKTDDD